MTNDLDTVDRQIISILQQDGRTPNVEIARRVGVSEATIRKRLERLINDKVIRITAIPDATKVGLSTVTFLMLDVDLSRVEQVAGELANLPEVRAIHYTTGEGDLIVEAWLPSTDDLLRFLTHHVASIAGIRQMATSHVLRTIKSSSEWVLPSAAPPQVLVVDDDPDFVEVVRLTLATEGLEIRSASNGQEAIASMRVHRPDMVILDVMMQGMLDGLMTSRQIRADENLKTVPILMISSITGSDFAKLLPREQAGLPVDNFMLKPIDPEQLLAETRRLVKLARENRG
jgi:Lrp/AsnC family transcriptional regulator for asnA, asnC and gidA